MPILMHRFKYITLVVILVAVFSPYLSAAPEKDKVKFTYDVGFEMNFDNREFYKSRFSNSMTSHLKCCTIFLFAVLSAKENPISFFQKVEIKKKTAST